MNAISIHPVSPLAIIPRSAWGLDKPLMTIIEGEPALVTAIIGQLAKTSAVLLVQDYPSKTDGWIGREVVYVE